jgi:hypothetical protein
VLACRAVAARAKRCGPCVERGDGNPPIRIGDARVSASGTRSSMTGNTPPIRPRPAWSLRDPSTSLFVLSPCPTAATIGRGAARPTDDIANAVPTRQAAIDCPVRLAGSRRGDLPVIEPLTSSTTQMVIQIHASQARTKAHLNSQCDTSAESNACFEVNERRAALRLQ